MTDGNPLGDFVRARRAQVRPADVGLAEGRRRRVTGLRREELALLADISVAYLVRLEQGHDRNPSPAVLGALADGLCLDDEGRRHLAALAGPIALRPRVAPATERVRPALARLLDHHVDAPALVLGACLDVLIANRLATELLPSFAPGRNIVHDVFCDPETRDRYPQLGEVQRTTAGSLRAAAAEIPDDQRVVSLVGELSIASAEFRSVWSRHDAHRKRAGSKTFLHPAVGSLTLDHDAFAVEAAPHQRLIVFHADPASAAGHSLALLRTLAADARSTRTVMDGATPADRPGSP